MKKTLLIIFSISVFQLIYCQIDDDFSITNPKNYFGFYSNIGISRPIQFTPSDDVLIYHGRESYSVGVKYLRLFSHTLKLEFGASLSKYKVRMETKDDYPIPNIEPFSETLSTISIPILLRLSNFKNYFLSFGPLIEFDLPRGSEWILDTQSGIGSTLSLGKEFSLKNITLEISPNLEIHSLIPFKVEDNKQRMLVFGIKSGINLIIK